MYFLLNNILHSWVLVDGLQCSPGGVFKCCRVFMKALLVTGHLMQREKILEGSWTALNRKELNSQLSNASAWEPP